MNDKIHIIAEGMGALVALKLLHDIWVGSIRRFNKSNIIFRASFGAKKDRKFFYKKLVKELANAYEQEGEQLMIQLKKVDNPQLLILLYR